MKKIIIYIITLFFAVFVHAQQQPKQEESNAIKFPEASQYSNTRFTYKITDAPDNTYCYDIYAGERIMIHQSSIPGIPGNKGFKTKAGAQKVAQLAISKIKKGEMPPTVSVEEMKKLKVIK